MARAFHDRRLACRAHAIEDRGSPMFEGPPRRRDRGRAASRFDEITLALAVVLLLVTIAGAGSAGERLGCGLNDAVNRLLAYPRPCR